MVLAANPSKPETVGWRTEAPDEILKEQGSELPPPPVEEGGLEFEDGDGETVKW